MFHNAVLIVLERDVVYGIVIPILEGGEAYSLYHDCYPRRGGMLLKKERGHIHITVIIFLQGRER